MPSVPAAAAGAIACGSVYPVEAGDTLHRIATRAYGAGTYMPIFEANRDILPDTASIEVGDPLFIPCLDGSGPRSRDEALAARTAPAPAAAPKIAASAPAPAALPTGLAAEPTLAAVVADTADIGLLTGSDFAPFADQRLPEGGMITELLKLSLGRSAPDHPAKVTFVNNWARHLDLLGSGEFDIGFPWYKPDCARADRLDPEMQRRCAGYVFSDPIFALTMGAYVRDGDALEAAASLDSLLGKRICRPAGYFTFDLDQEDLREPAVTRVVPRTAAECFQLLAAGQVDVVSITTAVAEPEISRLGLDGRVAEVRALATQQTLHALAPEASADGRAYIQAVNNGLADLRSSGRWFEVVSRHLGAFGMTIR